MRFAASASSPLGSALLLLLCSRTISTSTWRSPPAQCSDGQSRPNQSRRSSWLEDDECPQPSRSTRDCPAIPTHPVLVVWAAGSVATSPTSARLPPWPVILPGVLEAPTGVRLRALVADTVTVTQSPSHPERKNRQRAGTQNLCCRGTAEVARGLPCRWPAPGEPGWQTQGQVDTSLRTRASGRSRS